MISEVLDARANGATARTWKSLVPPTHQQELHPRPGLRSRYEKLSKAAESLTPQEAQQCLLSVRSTSFYEDVLSGAVSYKASFKATVSFNSALKGLLSFGFELLKEFKVNPGDIYTIRDDLYARAFAAMPEKVCPFCGLSTFRAPHPDMPREALDHYLSVSVYPLFGSYLPNLIPMCHSCNSSFKLATDMLVANDGSARVCVNPHGAQTAKVSLLNSEPFGNGRLPRWVIDFHPAIDAFETWDEVFKVRLRYRLDALDGNFYAWLGDFARWVKDGSVPVHDSRAVSEALCRWANLWIGFDDKGFLKSPMFTMLSESALRPDKVGRRVTQLVQTLCAM